MEAYVKVSEQGKVAVVEFFHPKSNAMSSKMLIKLAQEIDTLAKREDLNVIAIQSKGEVFCAGAFFDELLEINDSAQGEQFFLGFAKVILAIKMSKALVLTKVQGKAVGGAVGIIAASDYLIGSNDAKVRLSELTIGLGPFVISPVIKSKITNTSFMHLALNPQSWFDAEWCLQNKLFNSCVNINELDFAFEQKLEELSSYNTKAIHCLKSEENLTALESELHRLAIVSGDLVTSSDTKRILKTFIDR
ncbi:MAG: methylglutaconyl-CoA hydratase [Glaciecola sp.]|jgi:methylglutaconyl-CoA hydratase